MANSEEALYQRTSLELKRCALMRDSHLIGDDVGESREGSGHQLGTRYLKLPPGTTSWTRDEALLNLAS